MDTSNQKKEEHKNNRLEVIKRFDEIQQYLYGVTVIIHTISEFILIDFGEDKNENKNIGIITKLAGLQLQSIKISWNRLNKFLYLRFPITISNKHFDDLEYFLNNINSVLNENNEDENTLEILQDKINNPGASSGVCFSLESLE